MRKRAATMAATMLVTSSIIVGVFVLTAPATAFGNGTHWGKCPPGQAEKGVC